MSPSPPTPHKLLVKFRRKMDENKVGEKYRCVIGQNNLNEGKMAIHLINKRIEVCDLSRVREIVFRRLTGAPSSPNPLATILNHTAPERGIPGLDRLPKAGSPEFERLIKPSQLISHIEQIPGRGNLDREFKATVLELRNLYLQMERDSKELETDATTDDQAKIGKLNEKYGERLQELWIKIYGLMRRNLGFSYIKICEQLDKFIKNSPDASSAHLIPQDMLQSTPLKESKRLEAEGKSKNKIKENLMRMVPPELQTILEHRAYVQRELQRFYLSSPFLRRIYDKPLGYAGDFEMLRYLYDNKIEGRNLFEKMIHFFAMDWETAHAVRDRISYSTAKIKECYGQEKEGDFTFANIACGGAHETVEMINGGEIKHANIVLFDQEALAWRSIANALGFNPDIPPEVNEKKESKGDVNVTFVKRSIAEIFKGKYRLPPCNLIYINGLFDYLTDELGALLIGILFQQIKPGGKLVIGNLSAKDKAAMGLMEAAIEWYLFYRDEKQLIELAKYLGDRAEVTVEKDRSGIQLYLVAQKKA